MNNIRIPHIATRYFLFLLFPLLSYGQNSEEQIQRLQRAIFIYNLSEQVTWSNEKDLETITIGVLGPDRASIDLQVMSQKRLIKGKPVKVKRFDQVKEIKNVQILYVNSIYNFDISYILKSISGKNILLISEDYNYNSSMINIVSVGNSFEYEINKGLLISENYLLKPSLEKYAITSIAKWKQLYKETEKNLEEEKEVVQSKIDQIKEKDTVIEKQKEEIARNKEALTDQEKIVLKKNDSIDALWSYADIQKQKFENKELIEKELEELIKKQLLYSKEQEDEISRRKLLIEKQKAIVDSQTLAIKTQKEEIDIQSVIIKKEKRINLLLYSIAGILFLGGVLLFRGYTRKRKLVAELTEKNKTIENQSIELTNKNKEIEQFAYIASHDLQEPLNTISNLIGILQEDYKDSFDEIGTQSLVFMEESSTRMRNLIKGLLKHSKLGKIDSFDEVNCNLLLEEVQQDLSNRIEKSKARITVSNLPTLQASEVELRLVFQNLISNAIKFSKEDLAPVISIGAKLIDVEENSSQLFWQFSITDNGIGIAKEYQERIFAIFQRLHSREAYEGTGIGLAHTKKIINAHGGEIWLHSTVGEGSTFYFTIPKTTT